MNEDRSKERFLGFVDEEIARRAPRREHAVLEAFAAEVLGGVDLEDLQERNPADIFATIHYAWQFLEVHDPALPKIALFNPSFAQHGWNSRHTALLVLCRGMPFVSESLRLELNRRNIVIYLQVSSDLTVQRDERHELRHLLSGNVPADGERLRREALVYMEVSRITDATELAELEKSFAEVIADVDEVVSDFAPMCARVSDLVSRFDRISTAVANTDRDEHRAFLEWLLDGNFTFLGYECLAVRHRGQKAKVEALPDSRLGLLKKHTPSSESDLQREIDENGASGAQRLQIEFSKWPERSRVHRIAYPDYITVKEYDASGRVHAQHGFLGLFTALVYTEQPREIPILRRKVAAVLERANPGTSSHRERTIRRVLEVLPRDELFQSELDTLSHTVMRIYHIQERHKIRLFIRLDRFCRFASCLVYWPRDIYRTELRLRIEKLLMEALGAVESEFTTFFSESVLVRTHFVMRLGDGPMPEFDAQELESLIVRVSQQWSDHLREVLLEEFGEEQGSRLCNLYANAFPSAYRDDYDPPMAVIDLRKFAAIEDSDHLAVHLYRAMNEAQNMLHFRLYSCGHAVELSDVIPMLENLGMRVLGERPYHIRRSDRATQWVHDFTLVYALADHIDLDAVRGAVESAFLSTVAGRAENDAFNRLIVGTGLDWREIAVLRAYAHYMKQLRYNVSQQFIAETLGRHLAVTRDLVALFRARFDPRAAGGRAEREAAQQLICERILAALEKIPQLNEDQVLRYCLALIRGTVRTNWFQKDADAQPRECFAFKLDARQLPDMPQPVPMFEIWVYSPRVEGVHLRGGKVARGGLRWSDRLEDFRTEILGLVKAQQVKNAVIVPVGAKGGFVLKQLRADATREAVQAEGVACYQLFVASLLDITDNIVGNEVVPPPDVVRHDEDDPYLVVAADKGTASFSDIANAIAERYGFWLRDAFASGGSVGYDHKKMAITARGAWISVQRHFREMGTDVQSEDFTVVGIGDMSGDVFGNGLLMSRHARLVAAFDHRHIFLDPDPDPESSFRERERLFSLPRSSWADYDAQLISSGGGVFPRSLKSITLTVEVRRVLEVAAERMTPMQLISAILAAPVDLIWNGGIGTYFKARSESHADVGDKSNDALRIDARRIRARVVGEGGNLGLSQLARIEYCARGGRCNTDFIDNSGGVDCSDHEVNIKILLNSVVAAGDMTDKQRARLLDEMRDEVAELVLRDNYRQVQAISIAERESLLRVNEYRSLLSSLEAAGVLDRALEFMPPDDVLIERRAKGSGLTRPELALLTCYVKSQLKLQVLASDIPEDAHLAQSIEEAFPRILATRYREGMYEHKLRREIVATQLTNDVVDHMGITFVERMSQSTNASVADIVRAYAVARDVFELRRLWQAVETLDNAIPAARQLEIHADLQRLLRLAARWFINNRRSRIDAAAEVAAFGGPVRAIRSTMGAMLLGEPKQAWEKRLTELQDAGVPPELAADLAASTMLLGALGMVEVARNQGEDVDVVARVAFMLNEQLGFYWFGKQITALKVDNYWQAMARESFLDEIDWQVRAIVAWVVRGCEGDCTQRIERWQQEQKPLIERWKRTIGEIRSAQSQEYAMFTYAVRMLLQLAQPSAAPRD